MSMISINTNLRILVGPNSTLTKPACKEMTNYPPLINTFSSLISSNVALLTTNNQRLKLHYNNK